MLSPAACVRVSTGPPTALPCVHSQDSNKLKSMMNDFNSTGMLSVDEETLKTAKRDFLSACCNEQDTIDIIQKYHTEHNYTLDPHTACGVMAVKKLQAEMVDACKAAGKKHKMVVLSTAHPAKFSMAVSKATGSPPVLPPGLEACQNSEVRFQVMPASTPAIKNLVEASVPDYTGNRNVYTPLHMASATLLIATAFVAGVFVGKKF